MLKSDLLRNLGRLGANELGYAIDTGALYIGTPTGNQLIGAGGSVASVTSSSSGTYIYSQDIAAATWSIEHNLGRYPSVTVVDSAGSVVIGDIKYISENEIEIYFIGSFSGQAYLN
jgi:hypothetical protein